MVSRKRIISAKNVPLLVSRGWLEENLDVGPTTISEMEKDRRLIPIAVPGVRANRYEGAAVVRMLGLADHVDEPNAVVAHDRERAGLADDVNKPNAAVAHGRELKRI